MLYSVQVKMNTSLCLPVLVSCRGVHVLDWGTGVQTEEVVLESL